MYRGIAHPNPSYISKIHDLPSEWITFPLKISMKNYQIQTDEYMAKSATFLNVCKSGSQTL